MSKLSDVLTLVKIYNGEIPIGRDGDTLYIVKPVDENNYDDIPENLVKQLKSENKYGWYCSVCVMRDNVSIESLPIYGHTDRYETKWFYSSIEDCINHDLRDKWMAIYERIMDFEENRQYIMER